MKVLLIDNGTKHLARLKRLLNGNILKTVGLFSEYPNFENYDLIILSGGSVVSIAGSPESFVQETKMVRESKTPIIGICQGCEIIATAYGSKLKFLDHKTKGVKKVHLEIESENFPKNVDVYEAHHYAIKTLGPDLVELAKSNDGVEMLKHKTKEIYGMQFHPEMLVNATFGDELFKYVVSLV